MQHSWDWLSVSYELKLRWPVRNYVQILNAELTTEKQTCININLDY